MKRVMLRRVLSTRLVNNFLSKFRAVCFSSGRKSAALSSKSSSNHSDKVELNPPKGTRDFYPDEFRLQSWLYGKWQAAAKSHGFEGYDSPVVENVSLYKRKSGEEISEQLYTFADKNGRQLCLRPEMTPSLARMVLSKGKALPLPIKWYSIPQCWRYEKMSKGRRREHYQWNMDIWGVKGVEAEAEILSAMVFSMKAVGLSCKDVGIRVNSKHLVVSILEQYNIREDIQPAVCIMIDKWDKLPRDTIMQEIHKIVPELNIEDISSLLDTINIKNIEDFKLILGECNSGLRDIERLFTLAEAYGYHDWLTFDATVVRGLSYYTGVVFEAFDRQGLYRAICGGGRYDCLLDSFSTNSKKLVNIPAVGFGFGDAVIVELLKGKNLIPDFSKDRVVDAVVCFLAGNDSSVELRETLQKLALKAAKKLRENGISVDLVLENKRAKWMFQRADKVNAGCILMFAPDELDDNAVVLRDMRQGTQATISQSHIVDGVQKLLS